VLANRAPGPKQRHQRSRVRDRSKTIAANGQIDHYRVQTRQGRPLVRGDALRPPWVSPIRGKDEQPEQRERQLAGWRALAHGGQTPVRVIHISQCRATATRSTRHHNSVTAKTIQLAGGGPPHDPGIPPRRRRPTTRSRAMGIAAHELKAQMLQAIAKQRRILVSRSIDPHRLTALKRMPNIPNASATQNQIHRPSQIREPRVCE